VDAGAVVDLNGTSQTLTGLSGSGLVTNGALTVSGTVVPGGTNAIGTLTLAASVSLSGGRLLADAAPDGACDLLKVQGSLDLAGASLRIQDVSRLATGKQYVLATCAPGALSGSLSPDFSGSGKWIICCNNGTGKVLLINRGSLFSIR